MAVLMAPEKDLRRLPPAEKLEMLRRLDSFRDWTSLDDQRFCICCDRLITGRQIEIDAGTRAHGALRLQCPTPDCEGMPIDWVRPGDAVPES